CRDAIRQQVCESGFDRERHAFVQYYGGPRFDASLLMMPIVGFLPPGDSRVQGTVRAIEEELFHGGLVRRYVADHQNENVDGLPPGEGAFLACTCWLSDNYILQD